MPKGIRQFILRFLLLITISGTGLQSLANQKNTTDVNETHYNASDSGGPDESSKEQFTNLNSESTNTAWWVFGLTLIFTGMAIFQARKSPINQVKRS